jgi:hypothetical protein
VSVKTAGVFPEVEAKISTPMVPRFNMGELAKVIKEATTRALVGSYRIYSTIELIFYESG